MKKIDMDRDSWQRKAKCRDGWRFLIKPNWKQSLSHRQTAMMMMI